MNQAMIVSDADLAAIFNDRSQPLDARLSQWANDNLVPAFIADCQQRIDRLVRDAEAARQARLESLRRDLEAAQRALAEAENVPLSIAPSPAKPSKVRRGGLAGLSDEEVHIEMKRRGVIRKATLAAKKAEGAAVTMPPVKTPSQTLLERHRELQVYRTPESAFTSLLDYRPDWFEGRGFDPSAGDGRMIGEIIKRGNPGPHFLNEIRQEEWPSLARLGEVTIGDYLDMANPPEADFFITNPPFKLTDEFIEKARTHVKGPIIIMQQAAWATTAKRSARLRGQGLAYILHLTKRPKWEMDGGATPPGRFYGFCWFVFLPGYEGLPVTDWLDDEGLTSDMLSLATTTKAARRVPV